MVEIGDDDGGGVPLWLIILTFAGYIAYFIAYGQNLPNLFSACSTFTGCLMGGLFGIVIGFFQILTLGGLDSPVPTIVQGPFLLVLALGWIPIFIRWITAATQAIATFVP